MRVFFALRDFTLELEGTEETLLPLTPRIASVTTEDLVPTSQSNGNLQYNVHVHVYIYTCTCTCTCIYIYMYMYRCMYINIVLKASHGLYCNLFLFIFLFIFIYLFIYIGTCDLFACKVVIGEK